MSSFTKLWIAFRSNRTTLVGLGVVVFFVVVATLAPLIAPFSATDTSSGGLQPPSLSHLMGTDDLGRDILSGFIYGAQVSLLVGILAAATSTITGILVGAIAGYSGSALDEFLMRVADVFMIVPRLVLVMVAVALFGASIWNVIISIAFFGGWPSTARLVRAEFMTLRDREYVVAAKAVGESKRRIIFSEILPNAIPSAIINGTLQVASAIQLEAALSFLGLSDPVLRSWGKMLGDAQQFLSTAWWMAVFPGIGILVLVLGLNLVGDGFNDALNPRLRAGRYDRKRFLKRLGLKG